MFRSVITVLITITGISSLQVAFFPRLPAAVLPEVNLDGMVSSQARLLEELPGQRSQDWALSPTRRYSLRSIEGRQASSAFSLSLTGVAVRRAEHLQVALVTLGDPSLEMDQRRVYQTTDGDEYAMGTIGGLDALQSCKVPSGPSGVTKQTLEQLTLPQPSDRQDPIGWIRRLAGLQSNRSYECVLVTLISSEKGQGDQLVDLWRKVLHASKDQPSKKS
jgi:hypothetical protein